MSGRENDPRSRLTPGDEGFYTGSMAGEIGDFEETKVGRRQTSLYVPSSYVSNQRLEEERRQTDQPQQEQATRVPEQQVAILQDPALRDAQAQGLTPDNINERLAQGVQDEQRAQTAQGVYTELVARAVGQELTPLLNGFAQIAERLNTTVGNLSQQVTGIGEVVRGVVEEQDVRFTQLEQRFGGQVVASSQGEVADAVTRSSGQGGSRSEEIQSASQARQVEATATPKAPERRPQPERPRRRERRAGEVYAEEWDFIEGMRESFRQVDAGEDERRVAWHAQSLNRWVGVVLGNEKENGGGLTLTDATKTVLKEYRAKCKEYQDKSEEQDEKPTIKDYQELTRLLEEVDMVRLFENVEQYHGYEPKGLEQLMISMANNAKGTVIERPGEVNKTKDYFLPAAKYSLLNPDGTVNRQNWRVFMRSQQNELNSDSPYASVNIMEFVGFKNQRETFIPIGRIYNAPEYFTERQVILVGDEEKGVVGKETFVDTPEALAFKGFQNNELFNPNIASNTLHQRQRRVVWKGGKLHTEYADNLMTDGPTSRWSWVWGESSHEDDSDHRVGLAFKDGVNAHKFLFELLHPSDNFKMLRDNKGREVSMMRKVLSVDGFDMMCQSLINRVLSTNPAYIDTYVEVAKKGLADICQLNPALQDSLQAAIDSLGEKKPELLDIFGNDAVKSAMKDRYRFSDPKVKDWYTEAVTRFITEPFLKELQKGVEQERAQVLGDTKKEKPYGDALDALLEIAPILHKGKGEINGNINDPQYQDIRARIRREKGLSSDDTDVIWSYLLEEYTRKMIGAVGKNPDEFLPFNSPNRDLPSQRIIHAALMDGVIGKDTLKAERDGKHTLNPMDKPYISDNVWNALPTLGYREEGDPDAIFGPTTYLRRNRLRRSEGRAGGGDLNTTGGNDKALPYDVIVQLQPPGTSRTISLAEGLGVEGLEYHPERHTGVYKCQTGMESGYGVMYEGNEKLVTTLSSSASLPDVSTLIKIQSGHVHIEGALKTWQEFVGTEKSRLDTYTGQAADSGSLNASRYYMGWEFNPETHKMELGFRYGKVMENSFTTEYLALKAEIERILTERARENAIKNRKDIPKKPETIPLSVAHDAYLIHKQVFGHYWDHLQTPWQEKDDKPVDAKLTSAKSDYTPRQKAYHGILSISKSPEPHDLNGVVVYHAGPLFTPEVAQLLVNPYSLFKAIEHYKPNTQQPEFKL